MRGKCLCSGCCFTQQRLRVMGELLRQEHRVNQAMPSLLLSTCAVYPTEEGVTLKMVPFSFILMDAFSAGLVTWAGSPNNHPWHCTIYPSVSEGDGKSKRTWQRGNEEAGQALLLFHLIVIFSTALVWETFGPAVPLCSETVKWQLQWHRYNCLLAKVKTTQAKPKTLFSVEFPFF